MSVCFADAEPEKRRDTEGFEKDHSNQIRVMSPSMFRGHSGTGAEFDHPAQHGVGVFKMGMVSPTDAAYFFNPIH